MLLCGNLASCASIRSKICLQLPDSLAIPGRCQVAAWVWSRLQAVLPSFSTPRNPLDVTGYIVVDGTLQRRALEVVVDDPNIDFVLNLVSIDGKRQFTPAVLASMLEQYDHLAAVIHAARLPVVLISNTCLDLQTVARSVVE